MLRTRSHVALALLVPLLAASLAACSGEIGSGNPAAPSTATGGGGTTTTTGSATGTGGDPTTTTGGPVTTTPPTDSCGGTLPGAYMSICASCHTQSGMANSRYPDLYKFTGTLDDFKNRVRMGSTKGMAPYGPDLVSDADVAAIYTYFTGNMRTGLDVVSLGDVKPLFADGGPKNPPIVFKRDDGVLVTRGAGRVRGRHEKEGSFGTFGEHYFEDR